MNQRQYRDVVQVNLGVCQRLKRNVLKINLEKEEISQSVEYDVIEKLFSKLGIKIQDVEGVQVIPPKSPRKVFVWFHPGVDLNKFCYNDSYRMSPGVKTGVIKPMDRREVEVLVKGLSINTPDASVL